MAKDGYKIVKDLHVLFTGANGHKTVGITVEYTGEVQPGYQKSFNINDNTIIGAINLAEFLDLTEQEALVLRQRTKVYSEQVNQL